LWQGEGHVLFDLRVAKQDLVDLARGDFLAAAVDQLLESTGEEKVARASTPANLPSAPVRIVCAILAWLTGA